MSINLNYISLSQLRDRSISNASFRRATHEIAHQLAREIATHSAGSPPVTLIPILRSGLALLPAFLEYFPDASIGMIGLQRDKQTAQAHCYYSSIPPLSPDHRIIILDPMIATGNTACAALDTLLKYVSIEQIIFVGIISATPGIQAIKQAYPEAHIIAVAQDANLDENHFIQPGLGDFGDRYFGT